MGCCRQADCTRPAGAAGRLKPLKARTGHYTAPRRLRYGGATLGAKLEGDPSRPRWAADPLREDRRVSSRRGGGVTQVKLTVHRATDQIGGNCIEIATDAGARIILDVGRPLDAPKEATGLIPGT